MGRVYLDHNARSPLTVAARQAMARALDVHGNPSSTHTEGQAARGLVEHARLQVGAMLRAEPKAVLFTSGATEALHHALAGALAGTGRRVVVTASTEHHAVLHELERLEVAGRITVRTVPVDAHGVVDMDAWKDALAEDVAVAVIMAANNETGVLHPHARALGLARRVGAFTLLDAAQVAGRVPLDVEGSRADALALSASKMGGPAGVGALWLRVGAAWKPPRQGGLQERARRPGTENVVGIAGMGAAAEHADPSAWEATRAHRDALEAGLQQRFPGVVIHGLGAERLPNTTFAGFPGVDAQVLIMLLDVAGLAVSSGSACVSGASQPSHVLRAMGVPPDLARASVRFSLGPGTSAEDVDRALAMLEACVPRARLRA